MTTDTELAARIADEQDLSKELLFWRTSSDLWTGMIRFLLPDENDALRKKAYKVAYEQLRADGTDLSRFPEPKE